MHTQRTQAQLSVPTLRRQQQRPPPSCTAPDAADERRDERRGGQEGPGALGPPAAWRRVSEAHGSARRRPQASQSQGRFYRRKKELREDQLNEIQDSFDLFDKDLDDKIGPEELQKVLKNLNEDKNANTYPIEKCKKMIAEYDEDDDGK